MITGYTSYKAQKQLRLCSRTLSRIAATYLYRTIYLEIQKDSIERMINIAFHDVLRYHVKELVLLECSQLVPFVSWREWYTHIENIADCKLNSETSNLLSNSKSKHIQTTTRASHSYPNRRKPWKSCFKCMKSTRLSAQQ